MTNRRKGGKRIRKSAAERRHNMAVEEQANRIRSVPRPTYSPTTVAIKVELAAQAAESRAKK